MNAILKNPLAGRPAPDAKVESTRPCRKQFRDALNDLENALIAADGAAEALSEMAAKNSVNLEAYGYLTARLSEHVMAANAAFTILHAEEFGEAQS